MIVLLVGTESRAAAPQPSPPLTVAQLPALIALCQQQGDYDIRTDISTFFGLTKGNDVLVLHVLTHSFRGGVTIEFAQLPHLADGYIFSAIKQGKLYVFHVDERLNLIAGLETIESKAPPAKTPAQFPPAEA